MRMEYDNAAAKADEAGAATLPRQTREALGAEIAQACLVHDQYLAEYGCPGEAVRSETDAAA